jgi:predicted nucleic acid-binding protein
MYAVGADHPAKPSCRAALQRAVDLRVRLVTDAEVLEEILYRYFSLDRPDLARAVYRNTVSLCDEVMPVAGQHTARALELLLQYERLSPRDAIHVATMEERNLRRLLSTDRDFDGLGLVERVDPARFAG